MAKHVFDIPRKFKLVKACKWDGEDLGQHLSDEDYNELVINRGGVYVNAREALKQAIEKSEEAYAIVHETSGVVYAVGGYTEEQTCWFMCSRYVKNFSKEQRKEFAEMLIQGRDIGLKAYPVLWNYIWAGNFAHVQFTERSGARMGKRVVAANDHAYIPFEFHREDFPHLTKEV